MKREGRKQVLAMLKGGGGTKSFEVFLTQELEVLAIVRGGTKSFHPLKGGTQKVLPCLEGGGVAKSSGPTIFPIFYILSWTWPMGPRSG